MSTEAITPQSAAEQSVSVAAPVQNQTSAVDEQQPQPATSETASAGSSAEGSQVSRQLNLDDFESLEDYAQALIEKKQSALSSQHSAEGAEETNSEDERSVLDI